MSGWLRTRDSANAGLTHHSCSPTARRSRNNFMADAAVKGTTGWKRYTITLPVPSNAELVEIGAMMQGKGTLWLDDVELEVQ